MLRNVTLKQFAQVLALEMIENALIDIDRWMELKLSGEEKKYYPMGTLKKNFEITELWIEDDSRIFGGYRWACANCGGSMKFINRAFILARKGLYRKFRATVYSSTNKPLYRLINNDVALEAAGIEV